MGIAKLRVCPKVTKMGSLIGYRIDHNGVGALRGQRHIPSKSQPKTPPPPLGWCPRWRGHSLIGIYGYVPLNRVWYSGSWVLNRVYGFTIKRLEQGVFFEWNPLKECEGYRWAVSNVYQQLLLLTISLQNVKLHSVSFNNYLPSVC